jgi:hypothetical protein
MTALPRRPGVVLSTFLVLAMVPVSVAPAQQRKKDAPAGEVFALLQVSRTPPRGTTEQPAPVDRKEYAGYFRTQEALLKSRFVLTAALAAPEVAKLPAVKQQADPVVWLQSRLTVHADKRAGLLHVSVTGGTPAEQALLVNAVVQAYLNEVVNRTHKNQDARLKALQTLYDKSADALREKRAALRQMAEALGTGDDKTAALKQQLAMQALLAIQTELLKVQNQRRQLTLEESALRARGQVKGDAPVTAEMLEDALQRDPAATKLATEINQLETAVAAFKRIAAMPEKEPGYRKLISRLEATRKELLARRAELTPVLTKQLRQRFRTEFATQLEAMQERIELLGKLETGLKDDLLAHTNAVHDLNKAAANLEWMRSDVEQVAEMARKLGARVQQLRLEMDVPPRVTLLAPAKAPAK